jgi:hypothetical protein
VGNDKVIRVWDHTTFVEMKKIPSSGTAASLNINAVKYIPELAVIITGSV